MGKLGKILGYRMKDIKNFPTATQISKMSPADRNILLATCYAFFSYSHDKCDHIRTAARVQAGVLGAFPVWYMSDKPHQKNYPPGQSFIREINRKQYVFSRTKTEFTAIRFTSEDENKVAPNSGLFAQIGSENGSEVKLISVFNVNSILFDQIDLILEDSLYFPRIVMVEGTGQAGLLVTTNHESRWHQRQHAVFPLEQLSFGRMQNPDSKLTDDKLSIEKFFLTCKYSMPISSFV